ncbi:MAG: 16S rRNA (uracil(1498)-N(3))-methyltransferase [Burkholderiales bacterium]
MARIYCAGTLASGATLLLPPAAARHVQVLRLQPGSALTLFNGQGGEFDAVVTHMGRSDVQVQIGAHHSAEREAARPVHLAVGIPANERMDWLVEKATELGAASLQPLLTERSVLRLSGERADKRLAHWQAIAVAACEQCGRNRVPLVHPLRSLAQWLATPPAGPQRWLLSLQPNAQAAGPLLAQAAGPLLAQAHTGNLPLILLSGPEGGLSPAEEAAALASGFAPVTLGPRVLRAETAPLALLALATLAL